MTTDTTNPVLEELIHYAEAVATAELALPITPGTYPAPDGSSGRNGLTTSSIVRLAIIRRAFALKLPIDAIEISEIDNDSQNLIACAFRRVIKEGAA